MKQMMSAPGDKAPEAGGQPAGVLDIGLGSTSLFAGKSRRRTVEMPPSSVVKQDSETEGKHGLALVSSEEHSTVRQDVSGSGLPSQQETNLSDPAANQTADPFAADPFETAPSLAFSEGLSLGFRSVCRRSGRFLRVIPVFRKTAWISWQIRSQEPCRMGTLYLALTLLLPFLLRFHQLH